MQPVGLYYILPLWIVDDFLFGNSIEGLIYNHEVTGTFTDESELFPDLLEEGISGPSPNDNYCLLVCLG